jgi:hypothetical protein
MDSLEATSLEARTVSATVSILHISRCQFSIFHQMKEPTRDRFTCKNYCACTTTGSVCNNSERVSVNMPEGWKFECESI